MFKIGILSLMLLCLQACSYTRSYVVEKQPAEKVFAVVKNYFENEHRKTVGPIEFMDFEFFSADPSQLSIELYFRDLEKGSLSKLSSEFSNWESAQKRVSKKVYLRFEPFGDNTVVHVELSSVFKSDKEHKRMNDYIQTLFLDLKKEL